MSAALPPDTGSSSADQGARLARAGLVAALASRVFGRLVGVLLVVLVAREAGEQTVALYGYLLGTATLVATLTDLGVAAIAGREVAAGRMPARGAAWVALPPQLVSVVAAAAATVVLCTVLGPDGIPPGALALTVLFVVVTGFVSLWGELLRGDGRVQLEAGLQMAASLALVGVGALVVHLGGSVGELLAVVAIKEVALLAVSVAVLPPQRWTEVRSRSLLQQSLWIAVAGAVLIFLWRSGTLVAGTGSISTLATYVVASRYLDAMVTVAHTAGIGLVPGMSALANDPVALAHSARRYLGLAVGAGLVSVLLGLTVARPLTLVPFGDRWGDAVPAVALTFVSALPVLVAFVTWPVLLARHQVRHAAVACVAGTAVGVVVSIVAFVASPTATSPAIGTLAGAVVLAAGMLWGVRDLIAPGGLPRRRAPGPAADPR